MGQAMGADFSGVKVHTDAQSDQLNKSIQAKAFTTGQDVFFRQGAYEPSSRGGQELIAHELTHVVQQNGGAVQRSPENVIQRWDSDAYETQKPDKYKLLLEQIQGITPTIGASLLRNLAMLTDGPEQLNTLLTRMGTSDLQKYLKSPNINASTLMKLTSMTGRPQAPQAPAFIRLVNDLIKFNIPIETYLENPAATLSGVQAQIASAEASAKMAAGLISANGTEIEFTSVNAVVGDEKTNEKAKVRQAVAALDQGTLVGRYHGNGEGNLPGVSGAGGYTEYYVDPPKGTPGPGARRLVVRDANHFTYYTWNHYGQGGILPAFKRIR
jgi:guanyl-specific ribonuclease Sa